MNRGSVLAFDVIFSIGLIIILVVAAALIIHMVVPYLGSDVACINGQKSHIKEINDTINDIKLTGITQIMKFKVESCVRCMWFDGGSNNQYNEIKIKWVGQGSDDDPQTIGVGVPWSGFGQRPDNGQTCGDGGTEQVKGGQWCTVEITPNRIMVVSGCETT